MSFYSKFYSKKYKYFLIVPVVVLLVTLALIFGLGIKQSIDLSGGTLVSIYTTQHINPKEVKTFLQDQFGLQDLSVNLSSGISNKRLDIQYLQQSELSSLKQKIDAIKAKYSQADAIASTKALLTQYNIDLNTINAKKYSDWISQLDLLYNTQKNIMSNKILTALHNKFNLDITNAAIKEISPTLSQSFYSKSVTVAIIAIIGIILLIFIVYRAFVPSIAIVASGIIDVLGGLAGLAIIGIPLSLVTIPALLMLLGYSIDTDVMLTTKLIKRHDASSVERAGSAMRTGIYMTTTSLGAIFVMMIFSVIYNVAVFFDISIVLIFGLVTDLFATWLMNAPIILWYVESKKKNKSGK